MLTKTTKTTLGLTFNDMETFKMLLVRANDEQLDRLERYLQHYKMTRISQRAMMKEYNLFNQEVQNE